MPWAVQFHPAFVDEFTGLTSGVQDALLSHLVPLAEFGPSLGRPLVDTLTGSALTNLKELRFRASGGVWRVAFVFDGQRVAVLLAAGDKQGANQVRFYRTLVATAEARFRTWEQDRWTSH